jgi:uncharacterized spore protein YtfJ
MAVPDTTQAASAAAVGAVHPATALLERLAERLGGKASVTAVFGEPVVADGVTVIPVAAASFGFGGGTGREAVTAGTRDGGGGGGVVTRPLGFIEITGGASVYKPIRDSRRDVAVSVAAVAAAVLTLRVARGLARRRR